MSFVLNSTLGMGGNDFEGSIQQPLVESVVIPIGDSSIEEPHHEASDNRSSSFERLLDLRHIREGSSRACERVPPSASFLEEEPIPVITILPFSPPTVRGMGDGGIIRVSPRSRHSHSAGTFSPPPFVVGYE